MNIEHEGAITDKKAKPPSHGPMTAVGELLYGPDAVDQMLNLSAFAGRAMVSAVTGTLRLASMISEKTGIGAPGVPTPGIQPGAIPNPVLGGGPK